MTTPRSIGPKLDERGIALALVLFAMVLSSALILGVFFAARLDQRMGDNSVESAQALAAAEAGTSSTLANWTIGNNTIPLGTSVTLTATPIGGAGTYTTTITRVNPNLFLVTTDGRTTLGGVARTRRQIASMAKLVQPNIPINAAITTRTGINVSGSSQVSGADSLPPSMANSCPPAGAAVPGIRDSSGSVSVSGSGTVAGNPPTMTDPSVNTGTFTQYGTTDFNTIAAQANLLVTNSTLTNLQPNPAGPGTCIIPSPTTNSINWGDPLNPLGACYNYFPVIYAPGNLRLSGGEGQGLLLVGGDLELSGGVEFYGAAIVLGRVFSTGTGGHIIGGVMARDGNFTTTLVSGNSVVNYSSCAIYRALNGAGIARPMDGRGWVQLY